MKNRAKFSCSMALCCVVSLIATVQVAVAAFPPQTQDLKTQTFSHTTFTYQGQLRDASGPVTGMFDLRFTLYATQASEEALRTVEHEGVALTNGLFRLPLDFGPAAVEASGGWVEVAVRAHGSTESYTVLSPRQKLTSMPYAILAQAEPWSLIGVPIGVPGRVDISAETPETVATDATISGDQVVNSRDPVKGDRPLSDGSQAALAPLATPNFIAKFGPPSPFGVNVVDSIMFDNGANVGVGTTSPSAKLSITATGDGARVLHLGTERAWVFKQLGTGASTALELTAADSNNNNKHFVINTEGNVGIGTTNPGSKLDVAGTAQLRGLDVAGTAQLRGTAGGTGLFVAANGNVGIGTTNPQRPLQIGPGFDSMFIILPSDASPNAGFIRFGDNTGWKLHFGRSRNSSGGAILGGTNGVLMTIQDNGNVGIGTINPGFKLDVAGTVRATSFIPPSDARLKTNVATLTNALEKLEQLRGVSFQWNEAAQALGHASGQRDIGVIAQEVETVFPELVYTSNTDGYKAVDYSRLTAVLIEAVKELNAGNEALKAENEALRTRLDALEQLVQKLTRLQE